MITRIKQHIALLLLLILQVIGTYDLYAALHVPYPSPEQSHHINEQINNRCDHPEAVLNEQPSTAFHKDIAVVLQDSDVLVDLPFSAKLFTAVWAHAVYFKFICQRIPIRYDLRSAEPTLDAGRYLLFSNLRI